jgi:hypothetical protein
MSATDEAKRIRTEYKRRGWSSRMVSVRSEYFSMGSAVRVEIKSPEVNAKVAEEIAERSEIIHRDQYSGEILGGGNRYVTVTHSSECRRIMAAPWIEPLRAALASIPAGDCSRIAGIDGAPEDAGVSMENTGTASLWIDGRGGHYFHPENGLVCPAVELAKRYGKPNLGTDAAKLARIAELEGQLAEVRKRNGN